MSKGFDYSKWDKIDLSDDEDDVHPNIDKASWFRWKHSARVEREGKEAAEIAEAAAFSVPAEGGEGMEDEVMISLMLVEGSEIKFESWIKIAELDLPSFAIPKYIRIVGDFPKTQTGKIQKHWSLADDKAKSPSEYSYGKPTSTSEHGGTVIRA